MPSNYRLLQEHSRTHLLTGQPLDWRRGSPNNVAQNKPAETVITAQQLTACGKNRCESQKTTECGLDCQREIVSC